MKGVRVIFQKALFFVIRLIMIPVMRAKYGFRTNHVPKTGGPFLFVSNHTTEDDMIFVMAAAGKHLYFVGGDHLLRNPVYGKLLRVCFDPIPVPKGGATVAAVAEIVKRLRHGENVALFPEGKRSYHGETTPSGNALGKLLKVSRASLVTYRIVGGYFTYPRWAKTHRKGRVEGSVVGVYPPEQLSKLSPDEITDLINRDIYVDDHEEQRAHLWTYRGKNKAEGMEHVLFICPRCKTFDSIETDGDEFRCASCGLKGRYNDYGFLEGDGLPFDNVHDWMRWIEREFDAYVDEKSDGAFLYKEDNVRLYRMIDGYKKEDILAGELKVFKDRMEIGTYVFDFKSVPALSILFGNTLLFTFGKEYFGLKSDRFRAWKCGRLYHLSKGDALDRTKEL